MWLWTWGLVYQRLGMCRFVLKLLGSVPHRVMALFSCTGFQHGCCQMFIIHDVKWVFSAVVCLEMWPRLTLDPGRHSPTLRGWCCGLRLRIQLLSYLCRARSWVGPVYSRTSLWVCLQPLTCRGNVVPLLQETGQEEGMGRKRVRHVVLCSKKW